MRWKNYISIIVIFCLLLAVVIFLRTLIFSFKVTSAETPQELRENAIILTTELFLKGENPFTLERIPAYVNSHGMIYNLAILPFAKIFGSSYFLHRLFSILFILGSGVVFYSYLKLLKVGIILRIICCCFLFGQIVIGGYDITVRSDSLGFLLFLLSIYIPRISNFKRSSLFFGLIFSFASFLAKQYFIIGTVYISLFLFFFRSKNSGILYTYTTIVFGLLFILVIHAIFPTYLFNTVYILFGQAGNDYQYLINQVRLFCEWNMGMIFVLVLSIFLYFFSTINKLLKEKKLALGMQRIINLQHPDKPLINFEISFETLALIVSLAVIFLKLGLHPGQFMVYFYHLITPFLLLIVFYIVSREKNLKIQSLFLVLILINLLFFYKKQVSNLPNKVENKAEWNKLKNYIYQHDKIYNSPETAYLIYKQGKPVYDNGHSDFVKYGLDVNNKYPLLANAEKHYQNFVQQINQDLKEQKYDLIIVVKYLLPYFSLETLNAYYKPEETLTIQMYRQQFYDEIWLPK